MNQHSPNDFTSLREKTGLSIEEVARELKVSPRTIYRYERGECDAPGIRLEKLIQLAKLRETAAKRKANPSFRFIDLFAGIGGLRKAFDEIGGKCVFTSEWDRFARDTYLANFPSGSDHEMVGDIKDYTKDDESLARIPEHDVLLAGFPCQPFSIAGVSKKNSLKRPHGFMCDTQGTLFFDVAKIIAHRKPKAFLLENVKNLKSHDGGRTFNTIMNVLENELHYQVEFKIVSSEPWVPQRRQRIFIVGYRDPNDFNFDHLEIPEGPGPKLGSILEKDVLEKYTLSPKLWNYLQDYKKKHGAKGNGFGCSVFGPDDITRTLSARYYKDGSEILVSQGKGKRPRRLTPKECARLMGYEMPGETFHIPVSDTQAYKQFGNGVVVPAVKAVAELMRPYIEDAVNKAKTDPTRQPELPLAANG